MKVLLIFPQSTLYSASIFQETHAMKPGIHPDYHPITVVMTDGTRYESRSTWGKPGDTLQLDVDPKTHPAWVGGTNLRKTGQMEKFQNKFKDFGSAAVK